MSESQENQRDEYLRVLGLVTVNFSSLENVITRFISELMIKASGSTDLREINFQLHLALLITAELPFYKLLTMLDSLYKHIERDEKPVNELVSLTNRAGQAANKRDAVVHSAWFRSTSDQETIRMKITAKKEKNKPTNLKFQIQSPSLEEVAAVADTLWDVYRDLNIFMVKHGYTYIKPSA